MNSPLSRAALLPIVLLAAGCAQMDLGSEGAKTVATGSAGGAHAQNVNSKLARCEAPLGTMAVVEDTAAPWFGVLTGQLRLGSTVPVLKLIAQQSNCFVVVDRGRAMDVAMQERSLRDSGEMRGSSNMQSGQVVAADYTLSPSITFSNNNAGRGSAGLGALLPGVIGAVAANLSVKEASTLLTLVDNRSGVQLAASEGSARNVDFGAGSALFGGLVGVGVGGYANTAEGKVIVAAFTDSFNGMVRAARQYRAQSVPGGLGTGGQLGVQGNAASVPAVPGTAAAPAGSNPPVALPTAAATAAPTGITPRRRRTAQ